MCEKSQKSYKTESLLFPGCMFIGIGVGLYFNAIAIGVMIGMGVGFIAMGTLKIIRSKNNYY